jgi:DNA mismatch endonuclease (patch repair protein)
MSRIKGKNTKPEMLVRKFLFANGFRYKLHDKKLPGKPDLVFPKYRKIVLVHGCFWHGHESCKYAVQPKSNKEYWAQKIKNNKARDNIVKLALKETGWNVIEIWECQLKPKAILTTLNSLYYELMKG